MQAQLHMIAKEEIGAYRFTKEDVLAQDRIGLISRRHSLERAERLGNAFHGKVRITFSTLEGGSHQVETTVWATSEDHIVLKGGIVLPVRAITHVEFA